MPEKDESGVAGEAKSVAGDFIQSLGLLELILGGVGLYGLWLWYGEQATRLFPSTGTTFIDIGLLAFAAALVGKLICLVVAVLMGLLWTIIKATDVLNYYANLTNALLKYHGVADLNALDAKLGQTDADVRGLASYYVVLADPKQQVYLERIQTKAIVAYSVWILSLLYVPYLYRAGAPSTMWGGAIAGTFLFLFLGLAEQHDYLKTLAERLLGVQTAKPSHGSTNRMGGPRWHRLVRHR